MGVLVDYSSSSSVESEETSFDRSRPSKKQRRELSPNEAACEREAAAPVSGKESSLSEMPPIPQAFHDLYASTVRQSIVDDPELHHGRKRQIPHIVGHWPSHVYVEWHPSATQNEELLKLLKCVKDLTGDLVVHDFLVSDLGAPLPLHISLSRPLSLPSSIKDSYLEEVTSALQKSSTEAFYVNPSNLAWYKSPDSNRSFLILRVISKSPSLEGAADNPELKNLLGRCNQVATSFGQPVLYQNCEKQALDNSFHVSIGWTFGLSDAATSRALSLLGDKEFRHMRTWDIEVTGVKVKIGNAVSHVALTGKEWKGDQLF